MNAVESIGFVRGNGVKIVLNVAITEADGMFVALSPSLFLTSRSNVSSHDAVARLKELVTFYIKKHLKKDTLDNELRRLGWYKRSEIDPLQEAKEIQSLELEVCED